MTSHFKKKYNCVQIGFIRIFFNKLQENLKQACFVVEELEDALNYQNSNLSKTLSGSGLYRPVSMTNLTFCD